MNVAMLGDSFLSWGGGRDFIMSCANALSAISKKRSLNIYLIVPGTEMPVTGQDSKSEFYKNLNENIQVIAHGGTQEGLIYLLNKIKADVVIPSHAPLGKDFPFPWVGYLCDFQHMYYPEFFTQAEREWRDRYFARILSEAKAIVVPSHSVKEDIIKVFPNTLCKVFGLPFSPMTFHDWFEEKEDIPKKYKLPPKYFLISNQFWIHKSHVTAFGALAMLKKMSNFDISIVCTGDTNDYRFPGYFNQLKEVIRKLGIEDRVIILGFIPKYDQVQIMRNAVAVLQPTLFEGGAGGLSVHQAVSLGVPAIVSDIPVNREIEDDRVTFFKVRSVEDLADKMAYVMANDPSNRPEKSVLLQEGKRYAEVLGERLFEAISVVMQD